MADCVDTDPLIHPGMVDDCGGGDEDCDGEVDEDCLPVEDTASSSVDTDDGTVGDDGVSGDDSPPDDPTDDPTVDTGSHGGGDSGGPAEDGTADTSSETVPEYSESDADEEIDPGSGPTGKPGKGGKCGCYSAVVPASWIWLVPLWVVVFRRRIVK
jgi:hypothetical protein